jgi:nucleotide-binding universal stress UspA family protein
MTTLFNRVLIALPNDANQAVAIAKTGMSVAQTYHANLRMVSIIPPTVPVSSIPPAVAPVGAMHVKMSEHELKERSALLETLIEQHTPRDKADQIVRFGNPAQEIEAEADEWQADLIILGPNERNWLERLIIPSVSKHVTKNANCAVMILSQSMINVAT